jgi:hypothetical protein
MAPGVIRAVLGNSGGLLHLSYNRSAAINAQIKIVWRAFDNVRKCLSTFRRLAGNISLIQSIAYGI